MHVIVFLWQQMWPNVFAPSFWTLLGVGLSHARLMRRQNKHHEAQLRAIKESK